MLDENKVAFLAVKYDEDEIILDQYGLNSIDFRNGYYLKSDCISCGRTYEREDGTILRKESIIIHGSEEDIISTRGDLQSVSPRRGLICKNCYDEIQSVLEEWIETNPNKLVSHSI